MAIFLTLLVSFELYQAITDNNFQKIYSFTFIGLSCACGHFVSEAFRAFSKDQLPSNKE